MEERNKLKPCPFCGRRAILVYDSNGYYVECGNGNCAVLPTTWYYETEEEAVESWNRRANNDDD